MRESGPLNIATSRVVGALMTELYQHPNSEQALCEQCVKDTMNYSAGMRLRDWMQVEDGKCGRCAAMPELDHEFIRANTSVRDGVCTQVIKSTDPKMPMLVFSPLVAKKTGSSTVRTSCSVCRSSLRFKGP